MRSITNFADRVANQVIDQINRGQPLTIAEQLILGQWIVDCHNDLLQQNVEITGLRIKKAIKEKVLNEFRQALKAQDNHIVDLQAKLAEREKAIDELRQYIHHKQELPIGDGLFGLR